MRYDRTIAVRLDRHDALCHGCQARLRVGQPGINEAWPYRLRTDPMDQRHINLLLQAAAEFDHLGGGTAVEFMDWVTPDALGLLSQIYPEFDGIAVDNGGRQSQPFPLPLHHTPEPKARPMG